MQKISQQLTSLPERSKNWKKKNRRVIEQIKSLRRLDQVCNTAHHQVFTSTNCLECANCCKTTGPLFTAKDVDRLARHFKLSPVDFSYKYLRIDEDQDMVLKKVPCVFLADDNSCQIYDIRPKACREYPHTNARQQVKIFDLTLQNSEICPAVLEILQKLAKITGS